MRVSDRSLAAAAPTPPSLCAAEYLCQLQS